MTSLSGLTLGFVDPGLRKAPFFLDLRHRLAPNIQCVYYSRRTIVRGFVRSAGAPLFPSMWRWPRTYCISDESLREAMGEKEWTVRGPKLARRARRLLFDLDQFLEGQKLDAVLVWNGSNLVVSLAAYLARQRGLPVIYAEHGYLPGTLQLDTRGINYHSSVTACVQQGLATLPAEPTLDLALDQEIQAYKNGKPMRARTPRVPTHLKKDIRSFLHRELDQRLKLWVRRKYAETGAKDPALPERFVLLPFQVRKDSQLILHSPIVGNDMGRLLGLVHEALGLVDPSLRIVVKFHPRENPRVQLRYAELKRQYPDVLFVRQYPMRDLLDKAQAVVTVNSTVGFEAFLYDKPVVALGRNFYTGPGLVEPVAQAESLPDALTKALHGPVEHGMRRAFLRFVVARFLTFGSYDDYSDRSYEAVAARIQALLAESKIAQRHAETVTPNRSTVIAASFPAQHVMESLV